MRFPHITVVVGLILLCVGTPGRAEKRVALVIGNDRYVNLGVNEQLQKAVNDAHAVGGALRQIGFEVIEGENLDRRALVGRLNELTQRVAPGDTAFFFFSGHGVAIDGVNYILPADVPDIAAGQETLLKNEALAEQAIIGELTGRGVRVAIVVLDACRTNPFGRPGGKGVGVAKGLAPPPQVQGVFSLYAAASGQSALDRLYEGDPNPNSVFSRVLVPLLTKPGLDLRDLAYEVREEVARIARTGGYDQRPASYDETVGGRVYLAGLPPGQDQPPRMPVGAASDAERTAQAAAAAQTWTHIQSTTNLAVLDDFIHQYGHVPVYGPLARARREEVAKELSKETGKPQLAVAESPEARLPWLGEAVIKTRSPFLGARIANLTPSLAEELRIDKDTRGVVVIDVENGSTADNFGLRKGDIVLTVNNIKIETTRDLVHVLSQPSRMWRLTIQRGERQISVVYNG
jgi:hypothetical protein